MANRQPAVLLPLAILAGFVAVTLRGPESAKQAQQSASTASSSGEDLTPGQVPPQLKPLIEAEGGSRTTSEATTVDKASCAQSLKSISEGRGHLTRLVAMMPDPIETRLDFEFDREVEAIRLAAADAGYFPQHYYLPWRRTAAGSSVLAPGNDADSGAVVTSRPESPDIHKTQPGILLFRKADANVPTYLAVLLVGESPTLGPHSGALAQALKLAWTPLASCGLRPPGNPVPLYIIGPRFSGSAGSFGRIIKRDLDNDCQRTVCIRSGTATNLEVADQLGKLGLATDGCPLFRSMQPPDSLVLRATASYLGQHAPLIESSGSLALLYEGSTEYGAAAGAAVAFKDATRVPYPSNISAYRALAERSGTLASLADSLPQAFARSRPLFALDGHERSNELPRALSVEVANFAGMTLEASIADLARSGTNVVALFGTSPLDQIFLANMVRRGLPNAQIAAFNADVLYAHPQFAEYLSGTWLFTPYPPIAASTGNAGPGYPDQAAEITWFSSDRAAGVHDAIIVSLRELQQRAPTNSIIEARPHLGLLRPNLDWPLELAVLVVGRSGLWMGDHTRLDPPLPLSPERQFVWTASETLRDSLTSSDGTLGRRPTRGVSFDALLTTLAIFATGIVLVSFGKSLPLDIGQSLMLAGTGFGKRCTYLAAIVTILFLVIGCLVHAALLQGWFYGPPITRVILWLGAAVWVALAVAFAMLAAGVIANNSLFHWRSAWIALLLAVTVFAIVGALSTDPSLRDSAPDVDKYFALLRADRLTALSSGVTPIIPLLLLSTAAILGLVTAIKRRENLYLYVGTELLTQYDRSLRRLLRKLRLSADDPKLSKRPFWLRHWTTLAAIGTVAVFVPVLVQRYVPTLEGRPLDFLLLATSLGIAASAVQAALRLITIWTGLKAILAHLAWTHLSFAFHRLPDKIGEGLDLQVPFRTEPDLLRRSLAQYQMLHNEAAAQVKGNLDWTMLRMGELGMKNNEPLILARALNLPTGPQISSVMQALYAAGGRYFKAIRWRWMIEPEPDLKHCNVAFDAKEEGDVLRQFTSSLESDKLPLRLAEDFVAAQFARLFGSTFIQLKLLAARAVSMALLLLLALASYPLQPQRALAAGAIAVVVVVATIVTTIVIQQERNEILSYLRNRSPNRVDFDLSFVGQIFSYAVLPLLTILATAFPVFGTGIARLVDWMGI